MLHNISTNIIKLHELKNRKFFAHNLADPLILLNSVYVYVYTLLTRDMRRKFIVYIIQYLNCNAYNRFLSLNLPSSLTWNTFFKRHCPIQGSALSFAHFNRNVGCLTNFLISKNHFVDPTTQRRTVITTAKKRFPFTSEPRGNICTNISFPPSERFFDMAIGK